MVSALHMEPWVQCSMSMSMWCFPEYPRPLHQLIWELQPLPLEAQLQPLALEAEAPTRMDTIPEPPSAPLAWPSFGFCAPAQQLPARLHHLNIGSSHCQCQWIMHMVCFYKPSQFGLGNRCLGKPSRWLWRMKHLPSMSI